jgi:hypothetical protein
LNTGDGNLGIWQENGNYHIAVADKTAYNGGNGETTNGANIDQGKNTGAGNSGGDGSGSQVSEGAIGVNSESKQGVSSGNDNGAKAGSTGENKPVEAGSKANAEGSVNADGSPAKTAEPSATDSGIAKNTQILEDAFKGDPQFKGTTFPRQSEIFNELLQDRSRLLDLALEKIPEADKTPLEKEAVPSAMAKLLFEDKGTSIEDKLRIGKTSFAASKSGQGLSLNRIGEGDSLGKLKEAIEAKSGGEKGAKAVEEEVRKAKTAISKRAAKIIDYNKILDLITCD